MTYSPHDFRDRHESLKPHGDWFQGGSLGDEARSKRSSLHAPEVSRQLTRRLLPASFNTSHGEAK
jgi:hypothetical protein